MTDPRYTKLAELLVEYSTALKKGDRVLLDMIDVPDEFTIELMRAVRKRGAIPIVEMPPHPRHPRNPARHQRKARRLARDIEMFRMKKMQAYIAIRGSAKRQRKLRMCRVIGWSLYTKIMRPVLNYRVNKTRWCVLRWPTPSMAQARRHEHRGV